MKDNINPKYYKSNNVEVIDVINAFTKNLNGIEGFITGNIIKYACRWKDKNGIEDLKKIAWYVNKLINYLEKEGK